MTPLRRGLRAIGTETRLTWLLWMYGLVLAGVATLPLAGWLTNATARAPEYDQLLSGLRLGVLNELTNYDLTSVWALHVWWTLAMAGLVVLGNAWMSAGVIGLLLDDDSRTLARFGARAGQRFWRFLRASIYVALIAAAVFASGSTALSRLGRYVSERGTDWGSWTFGMLALGMLALAFAWVSLTLDYARIRICVEGRGPLPSVLYSFWFVLRRARHVAAPALVLWALFAALVAAYVALEQQLGNLTWPAIAATIVLQQAFMFVRSAWRVGVLATEVALYQRLHHPEALAHLLVAARNAAPTGMVGLGAVLNPADRRALRAPREE